jgi:hypothetical protein
VAGRLRAGGLGRLARRGRIRWRALARRAGEGEHGSLSLELAFIAPAVLLVLFTGIQADLWYYARSCALASAQQGVDTARLRGASLSEGVGSAQDLLARGSSGILTDTRVSASTGATIHVTVTGQVLNLVPFWHLTVRQSASGPREQLTPGGAP